MSKKMICPNCEAEQLVEPIKENRRITVKGEPFAVDVTLWRCLECHEEINDDDSPMDENDLAFREYRKKHGLMQPEEINALREEYGFTQSELAKLLGWSPATVSRYENGSLQETSHDNLLQILKDPRNVLKLLNDRQVEWPDARFGEIVQKAVQIFDQQRGDLLVDNFNMFSSSIFSGNSKFDFSKFASFSQKLLSECGKKLPKTKFIKLCFYADFKHFQTHSKSISGLTYYHLPYGPCPMDYQLLIDQLLQNQFLEINILSLQKEGNEYTIEMLSQGTKNPEVTLDEKEKKTIHFVCQKLKDKTAKELSDMSHEEKAYLATEMSEKISYEYARYLNI